MTQPREITAQHVTFLFQSHPGLGVASWRGSSLHFRAPGEYLLFQFELPPFLLELVEVVFGLGSRDGTFSWKFLAIYLCLRIEHGRQGTKGENANIWVKN